GVAPGPGDGSGAAGAGAGTVPALILLTIFVNIPSSMKTTVDIPDPLLDEARRAAERDGTTLKALVETGLRRGLAQRRGRGGPLRLRDARFRGKGLQPGVASGDWEAIRGEIYEGRGE